MGCNFTSLGDLLRYRAIVGVVGYTEGHVTIDHKRSFLQFIFIYMLFSATVFSGIYSTWLLTTSCDRLAHLLHYFSLYKVLFSCPIPAASLAIAHYLPCIGCLSNAIRDMSTPRILPLISVCVERRCSNAKISETIRWELNVVMVHFPYPYVGQ